MSLNLTYGKYFKFICRRLKHHSNSFFQGFCSVVFCDVFIVCYIIDAPDADHEPYNYDSICWNITGSVGGADNFCTDFDFCFSCINLIRLRYQTIIF